MAPRSEKLLSEPHIIAQVATRTVGDEIVNWSHLIDDYDKIRDLIAKSVKGFELFNERLEKEKLLELPNGPRAGQFTNDIGKARFTINALPDYEIREEEFLMMTIRSHDQFNTTVYGLDDRYRGIFGTREVVLMNISDIRKMGLDMSRKVILYNEYDNQHRSVPGLKIVQYDIPEKCIATYYPECNPLIPIGLKARKSNTPAFKSVRVKIRQ